MSETKQTEPLAVRAERRARKVARERGLPGAWELFLMDAYAEEAGLPVPMSSTRIDR